MSAPCPRCQSLDGHHPLACWAEEFAARDEVAA